MADEKADKAKAEKKAKRKSKDEVKKAGFSATKIGRASCRERV